MVYARDFLLAAVAFAGAALAYFHALGDLLG